MNKRILNSIPFILVALIVLIVHSNLLEPVTHLAPHGDDWKVLVWDKVLGPDIFIRFFDIAKEFSIGWTYQIYHLWILDSLFGFNPEAFQKANIVLKSIAALSLFPLILVVFRSSLLGSLTVILFAIGYTSSATLEWVITGGDYIALTFMNLFLLVYYYVVTKESFKPYRLFLLSFLFIVTIFFSPMRMYPFVVLPILVETFLLLHNRNIKFFKKSFVRLAAIYWIFILFIFKPAELITIFSMIPKYIESVQSNWYSILTPVTGIGLVALDPSTTGELFGLFDALNLKGYLLYSLKPIVYSLILALMIVFLYSRKYFRFVGLLLLINFILGLASFLLFYPSLNNGSDPSAFKSTLVGLLILSLTIVSYFEWEIQENKDPLLLALWVGPVLTLLFIFLTVLFAGSKLSFSPIHRYLMIPSVGIYLVIAAILTSMINKARKIRKITLKLFLISIPIIYLIFVYQISKWEIFDHYASKLNIGRSWSDQKRIHNKISALLEKDNFNIYEPSFFYFVNASNKDGEFFYEALTGSNFIYWMHLEKRNLFDGCIGYIFGEEADLKPLIVTKNGEKGIEYLGTCLVRNNNQINKFLSNNVPKVFYSPNNIYVFLLKDKDISDITDQVLIELRLRK